MDGTTAMSVAAVGPFNPGPNWQIKGSGDFNGDGKSDILWQGSDGMPAIWLMDGINFVSTSAAGSFNPGPSWQVKGSGDFNGDGKSDILWQGSDGTPAIWLMDGATAVSVSAAGMASNQKLGFGSGTDADFSDPRGRPSWGDPPGATLLGYENRKAAHGLRKVGATRAAENGATVAELEGLFGWSGGGMAALYTREANRARLSKGAIGKLERTPDERSIPAPDDKVRAAGENPK